MELHEHILFSLVHLARMLLSRVRGGHETGRSCHRVRPAPSFILIVAERIPDSCSASMFVVLKPLGPDKWKFAHRGLLVESLLEEVSLSFLEPLDAELYYPEPECIIRMGPIDQGKFRIIMDMRQLCKGIKLRGSGLMSFT